MTLPGAQNDPKKTLPSRKTGGGGRHPQEPSLRCPRCDSPNTKFCYYNNYSLAQPRHFCKSCRRYWTRGGALRSVPIGGGCRKSKKPKPFLSGDSAGLKFFQVVAPAMDFQLGGLDFPKIPPDSGLPDLFPSLAIFSSACGPITANPCFSAGFQEMGSFNPQNSLVTSSIESLSSINEELHWKLQRQRLATLFPAGGDGNQKAAIAPQKQQPVLFRDTEVYKNPELHSCGGVRKKTCDDGSCGEKNSNTGLSTDWFFDHSYPTVAPAPLMNAGNLNEGVSNWSNGIQGLYYP